MKYILFWFLSFTAFVLIGISTLAFVSICRSIIKKTNEEKSLALMGVFLFWSVGGLFLFLAYLAS